MGRGKKRFTTTRSGRTRLIPLTAPSEAPPARALPQSLKPKYAQREPDADALRYARTHAQNVRHGEVEGAIKLLREHQAYLRRGYPALDTLLESLVVRAVKDAESELDLAERRRQAGELLGHSLPKPAGEPELVDAARQALIAGLRQPGDPLAQARAAAAEVRVARLATFVGWSLHDRERLVDERLRPLSLDRFLWRAYGRDYESMPWPFTEEIGRLVGQAFAALPLTASGRELEDELLGRLLADYWPDSLAFVHSELAVATFSAKWPTDRERLARIAAVAATVTPLAAEAAADS